MSWSLGEVASLSVKAARGAGFSWGMAEEAGWAVRWLAAQGLPGAEALASVLSGDAPGGCPISLGTQVADARDLDHPGLVDVHRPLLLLPFAGRVAGDGVIRVSCGPARCHVCAMGTDLAGDLPALSAVTLSAARAAVSVRPPVHRVAQIDAAALTILEGLAARTYAPATDASRNAGAGAGLTDND